MGLYPPRLVDEPATYWTEVDIEVLQDSGRDNQAVEAQTAEGDPQTAGSRVRSYTVLVEETRPNHCLALTWQRAVAFPTGDAEHPVAPVETGIAETVVHANRL